MDVGLVQSGQGLKDIALVHKLRMTHGFIFQQTLREIKEKILPMNLSN
jgi:hypothetical protein